MTQGFQRHRGGGAEQGEEEAAQGGAPLCRALQWAHAITLLSPADVGRRRPRPQARTLREQTRGQSRLSPMSADGGVETTLLPAQSCSDPQLL